MTTRMLLFLIFAIISDLSGQDFRGVITTKQYGVNKSLQTPQMNFKEGKIEMIDVDTLRHEYHVCGDTVFHFYNNGASGSAQIEDAFYLYQGESYSKKKIRPYYFKFRAPPSPLEQANRETWSKPPRKYRRKGYNACFIDKKNNQNFYTVLDTSIKYNWKGHEQGLLNHLFHKDGLHMKYLEEWKHITRENVFTYTYDEDYSCQSYIDSFRTKGEEVDLDEVLAITTPDYEMLPSDIRKPLAAIEAADLDGHRFDISKHEGKVLYIDMWASWCGPCKLEMKHMSKLTEMYSTNDVAFISLSVDEDDSREDWVKNINELEMTWHNAILDGGFDAAFCDHYSIISIPRYILVDRSGQVISHQAPRPSSDLITEWLDQLIIE